MSLNQNSDNHHVMCHMSCIATAVSSLVLMTRLTKCSPNESSGETNERKLIFFLACLSLVLMMVHVVVKTLDSLRNSTMELWVEIGCHVVSVALASLNLSYLRTLKSETCSSSEVNAMDVMANKNLIVLVTILSGVTLVQTSTRVLEHIAVRRN